MDNTLSIKLSISIITPKYNNISKDATNSMAA